MSATTLSPTTPPVAELHARFLGILDRLELHGRVAFRHLRPERREEAVAEMVALCWAWFTRLTRRGKDATQFASALAGYAARAVRSGRRLAGQERAGDVLSAGAQRRHGYRVEHLPASVAAPCEELYGDPHGQRRHDAWEQRLWDNTVTPPDQQAAFRIDFTAWLETLTPRERRLIYAMALNERTKDLSKEFDLSPGRISQLRREFQGGWERFCADPADGRAGART